MPQEVEKAISLTVLSFLSNSLMDVGVALTVCPLTVSFSALDSGG